jgi:two-component system chemotaxis response regulator CheB
MLKRVPAVGRMRAVVIGASAGASEALGAIVPGLPPRFPTPIFIVVHIPRNVPNILVDLLRPRSANPVHEALDKMPIDGGSIYVAPPDYHLLIEAAGHLSLSVDDPVNFSRPAIDVLFESASDVYTDGLVGILLSGASSDGARGLLAIRRRGGQTIVQEPATAQMAMMPRAAMRCGAAEHVLSPPDILRFLESEAAGFDGHS